MRTTKRWLTTALSALLTLTLFLSACSSGSNAPSNENGGNASTEPTNAAGSGTSEAYEITMAIPTFQTEPKDMALIQDAISKITKEKINATVKIMPIAFGNWQQQMNLMLSSGENLDLLVTFGAQGYATQAVTGKLAELDDLIEGESAAGIREALEPAFLNAPRIDGKLYGVPTVRDLASNFGYVMRKDLVDKYNININEIKTLDDVEKVLKTIKDNEPGLTPLAPGGAGNNGLLTGYNAYDLLGDSIGVMMDFNTLKVENLFETPLYADLLGKFRNWYKQGYVLRDAATNTVGANQLVKANKAFSYLGNMKPGFAAQESRAAGTEMVTVELLPATSSTSNVTGIMWSIAQNSKNKERAMMFLNMLYSDEEVVNLIDWGIEGKHYEKVSDTMIDFAAGVDATNSGYMPNWDWMTGNQFKSHIFKGNDENIWTQMASFNNESQKSKALGFNFNVDAVKTEYTAVTNVLNQFRVGLETGTLDPEKVLPEFNSKLKAAGIDKIIAEKQKQLDAWAAANGIK